jgi:hypothetical protein
MGAINYKFKELIYNLKNLKDIFVVTNAKFKGPLHTFDIFLS